MKTDRVFVLLLVVLLPLSGCFDGSTTGDAEGADAAEDAPSTTIVNNYYNNTTAVNMDSATPDYISVTLDTDRNNTTSTIATEYTNYLTIGTFNTSANTIVEMVYASISGFDSETGLWDSSKIGLSQIYFESHCDDDTYSAVLNEATSSTQSVVQLDGTIGSDCLIEVNLLVYDAYSEFSTAENDLDSSHTTTTTTEFHVEFAMMIFTATPM
jgi:hypothetical protein